MTDQKKGITVYCGSSAGNNPAYEQAAVELGVAIARKGLPLVYGGGHMGLMGAVGRSVRRHGGTSTAVIPQFMVDRGWNDCEATTTMITDSMHTRKAAMASMAVGVVALPGGVGTFEELCEIITWRQLGLYDGNIVVFNVAGYYNDWLCQIDRAVEAGFLPASHRNLFSVAASAEEAVAMATQAPEHKVEPKF